MRRHSQIVPQRHATRFVIAGLPRSGTNWLVHSLNSHSAIRCEGELLDDPYLSENPAFAADPAAGLTRLFQTQQQGRETIGFKLFYFHCWDYYEQHRSIWDYLRDDTDLRVMLIERRNLLRLVLSHELARQTNQWKLARGDVRVAPAGPLTLDPRELPGRFEALTAGMDRLREVFAAHERIELTYEDVFAQPDHWLLEIQQLLKVSPRTLQCGLLKQETRPLREAIANYDEIAESLAGTQWASFPETE